MDEVTAIDFSTRQIKTTSRLYSYDYLVLAPGSLSHHFNLPGITENAFDLKTIEHAILLRNHILSCFERALVEPNVAIRKQMLTYTLAHLEKIDVQVRLGTAVSEVTPQEIHLADGTRIPTQTVVWTAGVRGGIPGGSGSLPQARNGQVQVTPTLQTAMYPEVYVIGDLAQFMEGGQALPMVAPVAMQQGSTAAQNILRQINGQTPQPFHYCDPGTMVTIGRNAAVAHIKGRSFTGFLAWLVWLGVHLFRIIGFRNRLVVMFNWALDYLFFERSVRLIIPNGHKEK